MRRIRLAVCLALVLALAAVTLLACGPSAAEKAAQDRDACFANQTQIKMAMSVINADTGVYPEITSVTTKLDLKCPSGGTYSFDPTTATVSCSIHGHQ
jgi:hypothetical protein